MPSTHGVAILRRSASIVRVHRKGKALSAVLERRIDRAPGSTAAQALGSLLSGIDHFPKDAIIAVALSPADLACGDSWTLPDFLIDTASASIGAALSEPRCASETLETLLVRSQINGTTIQSVACDGGLAKDLLRVLSDHRISLITSVPAAIAQVFGEVSLSQGGERFEITAQNGAPIWRAYPVDNPADFQSLRWNNLEIPADQIAAFAAAACDPESVPNLLDAVPGRERTLFKRFRDPLLSLGAAAVLCLAALGVRFHREASSARRETAELRSIETALWKKFLPSETPRKGRLAQAMCDRLAELGEGDAAEFPSALAFWGEIGKRMPDPESMGLTLESLDLAPDGGRLAARVTASKDDPLKNAALLEAKLGESGKMTARGDYEVQGGQVQVRLRMDYRP